MPGDSRSQTVSVTNNSDKVAKITQAVTSTYFKLSDGQSAKLTPEEIVEAERFFWAECLIVNGVGTSAFYFDGYIKTVNPEMELQPGETLTFSIASFIDCAKTDNIYQGAGFAYNMRLAFGVDEKPMPEYTVTKVWNDDNAKDRPESVKVQLYNGTEVHGEPIELNSENNWTYKWMGITEGDLWRVEEIDVPTGYKASVAFDGGSNTFTLTNTKDKVEPPRPPVIPPVIDPVDPPEPPVVVPPEEDDPGNNETPEPPVDDHQTGADNPKTGDESQMALFILLLGGAVAGMVALRRKA